MTRAFPAVEIHTSFFMIVYVVLVLAFLSFLFLNSQPLPV